MYNLLQLFVKLSYCSSTEIQQTLLIACVSVSVYLDIAVATDQSTVVIDIKSIC